jgi:hypothetical protein
VVAINGFRRSIRWREDAFRDQQSPEFDIVRVIDVENLNRHAARGGHSDEAGAAPAEVISPSISSRVEERRESTGLRIDAQQVRAFAPIASRAGQAQIAQLRLAVMLNGDDMIDLERPRVGRLRQAAVFARILCPFTDLPIQISTYRHETIRYAARRFSTLGVPSTGESRGDCLRE